MLNPGTVVGGYRLEGLLGRGAMGEVYRASQLALDRPVAIKRIAAHLLDQPGAVQRFEREARCLARVHCENVVAVHDFGRFKDDQGGEHWLLVMELVDGVSLGKALQLRGRLTWGESAALARQVAEGLAAVAELGVVHRDLKPDNILVSRRGIAKITDFGLARAHDSTTMTAAGSMLGTPLYMPPEACRGEGVDFRGDLYSLGCTWFHCLAGEPPYRASTSIALLRMHLEEPVRDVAAVAGDMPADLRALLASLMAKEPAQRPASAQQVAETILRSPAASQLPRVLDVSSLPVGEQPTLVPGTPTPFTAPLTAPTQVATAATAVAATPVPGTGSATQATMVPPQAAAGKRTPVTALAIVAAAVIIALAVILRPGPATPTASATTSHPSTVIAMPPKPQVTGGDDAGVGEALKTGDTSLALQRAAAALEARPGDADATALVRLAVGAEVERLCQEVRHDDALKRLAEHRSRWVWLDTGPWEKAVAIDAATSLARQGRYNEAFDAFIDLRKRNLQDAEVAKAILLALPDHRGDNLVIESAAVVLRHGPKPADPLAVDILIEAMSTMGPNGSWAETIRASLVTHAPEAVPRARPLLAHADQEPRENAFALLSAAKQISDAEVVRFHVDQVLKLTSSYGASRESAQWLVEQIALPTWPERKAAARIAPMDDCLGLRSWNEHAETVIKALSSGFAEESLPLALKLCANEDQDVRWNGYRLLDALGALDQIDRDAFHARTVMIFNPLYDSADFHAALTWLAMTSGTPRALAAHQVLDEGLARVEQIYHSYRERDEEQKFRAVKERIRSINETRDRIRRP